jgi:hypothetical protein
MEESWPGASQLPLVRCHEHFHRVGLQLHVVTQSSFRHNLRHRHATEQSDRTDVEIWELETSYCSREWAVTIIIHVLQPQDFEPTMSCYSSKPYPRRMAIFMWRPVIMPRFFPVLWVSLAAHAMRGTDTWLQLKKRLTTTSLRTLHQKVQPKLLLTDTDRMLPHDDGTSSCGF